MKFPLQLLTATFFVIAMGEAKPQGPEDMVIKMEDPKNIDITKDIDITVTEHDMKKAAMDRTFCCVFAQNSCTNACGGASCYASCNAKCGLFGIFNCGTWTCSSLTSNCITTTTTTTTTEST